VNLKDKQREEKHEEETGKITITRIKISEKSNYKIEVYDNNKLKCI
jgi:hypothetical protein